MNRHTGAEALRQALLRQDVDVLFGYPGGAILPFYDALHGAAGPRHVLVRHEQAAAHAADGYARATGRVGVCVATSGPGATNLVTGLATAMMDGVPVVAITGQVPTNVLGTDAFQEADVVGITMSVTKYGFLVGHPEDIPAVVAEAFRLARSGRPGPTVIDVPKDVLLAPTTAGLHEGDAQEPERPSRNGTKPPDPAARTSGPALARARELLAAARRPVLMVGRGVILAGVTAELRELAERSDLPVVTTLLGLDAFPSTHRLCLGLPGMHGTERANRAIQASDLILGLGLRFDDRVTGHVPGFAPRAAIVHFDISPAAIGRTVTPTVRVVGDLARTLPAFLGGVSPASRPEWWADISGWPREAEPADDALPDGAGPLTGRTAARMLGRWIGERKAVLATDVGQHQMWLAQELRDADPRTHLTSGGLGTMGFALPAAIGAQVGCPDREVWVVAGDGGLQMSTPELATVKQENLPIRIVVFDNGTLGMVRQWQETVYGQRYVASAITSPDWVALARAYGIPARTASTAAELSDGLERLARQPGPALLDLRVPCNENVVPMIPPGATLSDMIVAPREGVLT